VWHTFDDTRLVRTRIDGASAPIPSGRLQRRINAVMIEPMIAPAIVPVPMSAA
jgi:hypothetical protein